VIATDWLRPAGLGHVLLGLTNRYFPQEVPADDALFFG
jgi:hypothetical protein